MTKPTQAQYDAAARAIRVEVVDPDIALEVPVIFRSSISEEFVTKMCADAARVALNTFTGTVEAPSVEPAQVQKPESQDEGSGQPWGARNPDSGE